MNILLIIVACLLLIDLTYLLLIMPRLSRKSAFSEINGIYFAHRGLHNNTCESGNIPDAPENSMKSFEKACTAGYGIELDIQLTKDDQVVVFHDEDLKRMCDIDGRVEDYSYKELTDFPLLGSSERIPLFKDVLNLVAGRVPLIVEYKIARHKLKVCALGDELLRAYEGPYVIESFHPFALNWYRKNNPAVIRGQLADRFTDKDEYRDFEYWMLQNLLFNFLTKPDFIAFNHEQTEMLSRLLCRKLYRNKAVAWTVKSPDELEKARKNYDWFIFEGFMP